MAIVVEVEVLAVTAGVVVVLVIFAQNTPFDLTKKETNYFSTLEEITEKQLMPM